MGKVKLSHAKIELLSILADRDPDKTIHVEGEGQVNGYLFETLQRRFRPAAGGLLNALAALGSAGFVSTCNVDSSPWRALPGPRAKKYSYLTPLGWEAWRNPVDHIAEQLAPDDYDRRYEPKGMWLRQIEALSPLKDCEPVPDTSTLDTRLADAIAIYDAKVAADRASMARWEKAQDVLSNMLLSRWALVSSDPKSTDDFSLGYVFGCCDLLMEVFRLERSAPEALATRVIVFGGVFGFERGAQYLRRCLDEFSANAELRRGATMGEEDALELLAHGECPNHWIKHVLGFPDAAS